MNLAGQLKKVGLSESEIKIYIYLLEHGLSSPPGIAQGLHIARTNTYNVLAKLRDKGLVTLHKKGKRTVYSASNPRTLLQTLENQKQTISELIPDLEALYLTQQNKPVIHFYEGLEGIKVFAEELLLAKEVLGILSMRKLYELDPKWVKSFQKKIKQKGVIFRDIITEDSKEVMKGHSESLKALHEAKYFPTKYQNASTDILIWGENVGFFTLEDPLFATKLTNKSLAQTFTMVFEFMWEQL